MPRTPLFGAPAVPLPVPVPPVIPSPQPLPPQFLAPYLVVPFAAVPDAASTTDSNLVVARPEIDPRFIVTAGPGIDPAIIRAPRVQGAPIWQRISASRFRR